MIETLTPTKRAHLEREADEHADKLLRAELILAWGNTTESHHVLLSGLIEYHTEMLNAIMFRLNKDDELRALDADIGATFDRIDADLAAL